MDKTEILLVQIRDTLIENGISVPNILLQYVLAPEKGMEWVCCLGQHGIRLLIQEYGSTPYEAVNKAHQVLISLTDKAITK